MQIAARPFRVCKHDSVNYGRPRLEWLETRTLMTGGWAIESPPFENLQPGPSPANDVCAWSYEMCSPIDGSLAASYGGEDAGGEHDVFDEFFMRQFGGDASAAASSGQFQYSPRLSAQLVRSELWSKSGPNATDFVDAYEETNHFLYAPSFELGYDTFESMNSWEVLGRGHEEWMAFGRALKHTHFPLPGLPLQPISTRPTASVVIVPTRMTAPTTDSTWRAAHELPPIGTARRGGEVEMIQMQATGTFADARPVSEQAESEIANGLSELTVPPAATTAQSDDAEPSDTPAAPQASQSAGPVTEFVASIRNVAAAGAFAVILTPPLSRLVAPQGDHVADSSFGSVVHAIWTWLRRRKERRGHMLDATEIEWDHQPLDDAIEAELASSPRTASTYLKLALVGVCASGAASVASLWQQTTARASEKRKSISTLVSPIHDGPTHPQAR